LKKNITVSQQKSMEVGEGGWEFWGRRQRKERKRRGRRTLMGGANGRGERHGGGLSPPGKGELAQKRAVYLLRWDGEGL